MADTLTSKGFKILDPLLNYDVNKFNDNFNLANSLIGVIICTSGTRPSTNLYNGMTLYETDTMRFVIRVAAAWVTYPGVVPIPDAATRATISAPWDGLTIYRADKDWHEVYDGAAWRVQGEQTVAALADITNPKTGQLALLSTDNYLYRYTGSVWQAVQSASNTNYVEYTRTVDQSIPNTTVQGILFNGAGPKTSVDVTTATVSGGTRFTVLRAGRWLWTVNGSFAGSVAGTFRGWWLENPVSGVRHGMQGGHVSSFFGGFSVSREITMAANDIIAAAAYQDSGGALTTLISQAPVNITGRWMGPT